MEDVRLDSLAGVGPVTTKKLSDAGIHNIMDLIVRGPVEIAEITGMDKDTSANIVEKARQSLVEAGMLAKDYVIATQIYKRRQEICKKTTGTE
jgi:DNA repair protein RadA